MASLGPIIFSTSATNAPRDWPTVMSQNFTCPAPYARVLPVHIREYVLLAAFIGKSESYRQRQRISPEPLTRSSYALISGIIGIFRRLLPDTISYKHCCSMGCYSNSCFKNQPRTMSSDTGTSILDEGLACIGQRVASILIQPADKDKHYITSLHNEVVSIF
jgi:hypothetical protein